MPLANPFKSVVGGKVSTLFEIRIDNDVVFHGTDRCSSGQVLRGAVLLCLPTPLKIEAVHLQLTGILRLLWSDSQYTLNGISEQKVDEKITLVTHKWEPFVRADKSGSIFKGVTLTEGYYEWPFELMLPGDTCESVEGIREASITYKLKATIARGKLAYDLHTYRRLRLIRTLESSAMQTAPPVVVENVWPDKMNYLIMVPQNVIALGGSIPLEARFTPLLKGLELGDIKIKLVETYKITFKPGTDDDNVLSHREEREVANWELAGTGENHRSDVIEDPEQDGWLMNTHLDLPNVLDKCLQDVDVQGIKIRHRLKVSVGLKNPDGHISELKATLPVTIFISPNTPLSETGDILGQPLHSASLEGEYPTVSPPRYGEHVLDQLYGELGIT